MSTTERNEHLGGLCAEANALRNLALAQDVDFDGVDGIPSEALLFGLGGGIGAGFELRSARGPHGWSSGVTFHGRGATGFEFVRNVIERLGIPSEFTSNADNVPTPFLVEVHPCHLPYLALPPQNDAMWSTHALVVYEVDRATGTARVGDLGEGTFEIPLSDLEAARTQAPGGQRSALFLRKRARSGRPLREAIELALRATVATLTTPSDSKHSFAAWRTLAAQLPDTTQRSGWAKLPGGKLYVVLADLYAGVEVLPGGGFHRAQFADFLDEAAEILGITSLTSAAKTYRKLAADWSAFSDAALPTEYAMLVETKQIWRQRVNLFRRHGPDYLPKVKQHSDRLRELARMAATDFPLSASASAALLLDLSARLQQLADDEEAAAHALGTALPA